MSFVESSEVPERTVEDHLEAITAAALTVRVALEDEHEAGVRRAVAELALEAAELAHMVATW